MNLKLVIKQVFPHPRGKTVSGCMSGKETSKTSFLKTSSVDTSVENEHFFL